ncbi:MAG: hypothetical protein ACLFU8_00105 [Anaerolineales bacterium]
MTSTTSSGIGLLNERALHAALKAWYARPGDRFEVPLSGYVIDLVRGDLLVEIQTGSFSKIKVKLAQLVPHHPLRLVYPIAHEKWLVKLPREGEEAPRRRKSPKRGRVEALFWELVSFPELFTEPNFSLEVLLTQEEEVRRYTGRRWRRGGWVTEERRLLEVVERRLFETPADVGALLPPALPALFTTADLAHALDGPRRLAQKMVYCLREMGQIEQVGKRGRAYLYAWER